MHPEYRKYHGRYADEHYHAGGKDEKKLDGTVKRNSLDDILQRQNRIADMMHLACSFSRMVLNWDMLHKTGVLHCQNGQAGCEGKCSAQKWQQGHCHFTLENT